VAVAHTNGFVVCQLGARMHYAVPRFLHEAGLLQRFYTDLYAKQPWQSMLASLPIGEARRLATRHTAIPDSLIRSYPMFGLTYARRNAGAKDPEQASEIFLWAGKVFGDNVVRDGFAGASAVYTFNTAALEILKAARQQGLRTVLEQTIAPRAVEERIMRCERERHAGWASPAAGGAAATATIAREEEEWRLADQIVCGSEFVSEGIRERGGPVERCAVVPYGVDLPIDAQPIRRGANRPLRVLTVGQVGLRKGAPYALEVARAVGSEIEFRWVGPVQIPASKASELASSVELTGSVARNEVRRHYEWADVFFLPSVCEGSATVTYEALAAGLPVVTTPAAGSQVRDGIDGFIVDAHDIEAACERLRRLRSDSSLLERMSSAALSAAASLTTESYKSRLLRLLSQNVT